MAESKYDFGLQPHGARVDSFAGFTETPLPFTSINSGTEDVDTKFSFSSRSMVSFDPSSTTSFREGLQQATVHPGVLSGNGYTLSDDSRNSMSDQFFAPQAIFSSLSNARTQHGQVTPPDDLSPKSMETKPAFVNGDIGSPVRVEKPAEPVKSDSKRKRSSKAGTGTSRKRGRKATVIIEEEDLDPEERAKRDQFLERNRVAAHKCRQKKKEWMAKLDDEFRDLSAKNKYLQAEVQLLSNTLYELKNLIFQHTDCRYGPIDEFIRLEAEKVQMRARFNSNPSGALQGTQQSQSSFAQANSESAVSRSNAFIAQSAADSERVMERASTECSDFESLRSKSTAPDGGMGDQWTDMLEQS
ncbi:Transcription factor Jun [Macrophomina phaseolina MS6]|uniref:Transcription factor Jun n=1 Tax=Macrophomina phaseolina (strain MS6) TaxID=1126212 RepID=K2R2S9_MACPH|nr:Transcription factor Jun [Macrophomina phaseolina MS6]